MLYANQISVQEGVPTDYKRISVITFLEKVSILTSKYWGVKKLQRPIFKFELPERISILDFDKLNEMEYIQIIEKAKTIFGNSIVFIAISPNNGRKIGVKFNSSSTQEELKSFLIENFKTIDKRAIGFEFNCFLPKEFIFINQAFSAFDLPKLVKNDVTVSCQSYNYGKKYLLSEISAKYPQTSKRANNSVFKFFLSAFRNGYGQDEVIDFARQNYTTSLADLERQAKNALQLAKNKKISYERIEITDELDFAKKYVDILQNASYRVLALQAPTGYGKTYNIVKNIKNCVIAVPTIALAHQTANSYEIGSLTGINSESDILEFDLFKQGQTDIIVCTYDQLYRFDLSNVIVVIDEAHELVNAIVYRKKTILAVQKSLAKAKKVLYISATLPKEYLKLIDVPIIDFSPQEAKKRIVQHQYYTGEVADLIKNIKSTNTDKHHLIFLNNKEKIDVSTDEETVGIFNFEGLETSKHYIELIENSMLINRITIVTSKINAGVNIIMPNSDIYVHYIADRANLIGVNPSDVCQFFGRIRKSNSTSFFLYERQKQTEKECYDFSYQTKQVYIKSQKEIAKLFSEQEQNGFEVGNINFQDAQVNGLGSFQCVNRISIGFWEVDFSQIAYVFELKKSKSKHIKDSLKNIDARYDVVCGDEILEFEKKSKTKKDKNSEIELVNEFCENFLSNDNHCRFVAKKSKNELLKEFFKPNGQEGYYDITLISQQIQILMCYCKLFKLSYSHNQIIGLFKGNSLAQLDKLVNDCENYFIFTANKKLLNVKQMEQKIILGKICEKIENNFETHQTAKEIIKLTKSVFGKHQGIYGVSLKEIDLNWVRKTVGFFAVFKYNKKTKSYDIRPNNVFFEENYAG